MTAQWPAGLPRPNREGYQRTYTDPRIKKRNEAGPPGYRRRFSSVAKLVTMVIDVDRNGKDIFDQFFEQDASFGSLPFTMPDPTTDGWVMKDDNGRPILGGNGKPLTRSGTWLCLFGDQMPVETVIGDRFRISFSVAVMP